MVVQCGTRTVVHGYCVYHYTSVRWAKDYVIVGIQCFIKVEFILKSRASASFYGDSEKGAVIADLS